MCKLLVVYVPSKATKMRSEVIPLGWWMMEKYDGVRVYWDGMKLCTSHDNRAIQVPPQYTEFFPTIPFEAELW